MMLDNETLERIERAADAAIPGDWSAGMCSDSVVSSLGASTTDLQHYGGHLIGESMARTTIDHIVQSQPSVVLALIAEIRRLRAIDLRDRFAGQVIQGLAAHDKGDAMRYGETEAQANARVAYSYADAMLAARDKGAK